MKSALRFTLLGVFAALGTGIAVCMALRLEPAAENDAAQEATALSAPSQSSSDRLAQAESGPDADLPFANVAEAAASLIEAGGAAHPAPAPLPPVSPAAATADAPSQLTMAHQMGRLEEKLRRAEEFAERQQKSWENILTTFQERGASNAQSAVLRQDEDGEEEHAKVAQHVENSLPPPGAVVRPLPAPSDAEAPEIVPEEGDRLNLNLRNSDLRQVLELLSDQHGLNIIASRTVQGTVSAKLTNVDVHAALDAVLKATGFIARRDGDVIYVATPEELLAIDHAHDQIGTRIYRPNYITAAEMQNLLTPLSTPGVGVISVSSASTVGIPADSVDAGGDSFSGSDVVLVQDYESVLKRIDQLLLEVDIRPLQVAIETMIVTVTLDDRNEMGVNFALLRDNSNAVLVSGAPVQNLATIPFDGGLKFGFLDSTLGVFIQALEDIGDTNVVAAPRVMVLNKQRAEVLIGSQLGYVSTTVTENAATQSVEFLEVGTQLRLRPFIASDGMIRLEVHPELSTGEVDVREGFTLPNKSVTQVTTNIMCPDGATVVIGGLIREDLSSNSTQIPVLGSLPWVGVAFRQRTETLARTETLVLLTPRIVSAPLAAAEGEQGRSEFLRRQDWRYDKMNPLAQRYYGKQYLRKATAAWNAGDPSVALRYVNLAIHFDPENRDAMNLRAEIVATSGHGDRTVETHLREGLTPWGHPLREYSRQGAPWEISGPPPVVDIEPPDPGLPGKISSLPPPPPYQQFGPVFPMGPPPVYVEEIPAGEIPDESQ